MDIYQGSYEHISKLIEDSERKNVKKESRSAINYDDALDMYAEGFDEKEKQDLKRKRKEYLVLVQEKKMEIELMIHPEVHTKRAKK
ncbi:uncharacterized protein [Periplaneta americana]|uniref:uncharacterized protein isoform X3 n=1 Tax=Periplaneta americana TaxID=6978 RepID=UPI0037E9B1E1